MVPPNAYAADLHGGSVSGCSTRPSRSPHSAPRVEASCSRMSTCLSNRRDRRAQHSYNCTPMEDARQDPGRTALSASRGDSTGVLAPRLMAYFPPYSAKPIPPLISLSHFASYPAFSFPSFVVRLTLPSSLHASSLSFLQIRYFNLIRFNRAHLHPFARLRHTFFVRPTNFASTNSIIPYFEPTFDCIVISIASIQLFSTAIDL